MNKIEEMRREFWTGICEGDLKTISSLFKHLQIDS